MSNDLRRQLAELRAMVEALTPSSTAEDYIAECFADAKFAAHRDAIVAALCRGDTPSYSFEVAADPDEGWQPTRYSVMWYQRDQPPITIMYTRRWRELRYGEHLGAPTSHDLTDEPPAQATSALVRASSHLTESQPMMNDTPTVSAPSETAVASVQGHTELPPEERARIQSEIARLRSEIQRLKPPERRQEPPTPPARAGVVRVDTPSASRPAWWDKQF